MPASPSSQALTPTDALLEKLMDVMLAAQRNYGDLTSMRFGLNPVADSVLDAAHEGIRAARAALREYVSEDTRMLNWLEAEHSRADPVMRLCVKQFYRRSGSEWANVQSPRQEIRKAIEEHK